MPCEGIKQFPAIAEEEQAVLGKESDEVSEAPRRLKRVFWVA